MHELTTSANLVGYETLEGGSSITAVLARSEVEAALSAGESAQLWFELGRDEDEETRLLTLEVESADLDEMLRLSAGAEVVLAFDGDVAAGLFDDADVEAHGIRGALAIAVVAAAIAAPTSLAAAPQTADAAASAQRASRAATAQQVGVAATAQVSNVAAKAQVSSVAAKAQVSSVAARTQINKRLVVKAGGVKFMPRGLAR